MNVFLIFMIVLILFVFLTFVALISRYRRCPSDKILVIFGKTGEGSAKCIHGGAAFVWPLFQDSSYLDLTPISIDIPLQGALSKENIRISAPSTFTVGISTENYIMKNAAERLLGLDYGDVKKVAEDIIFGQFRATIATMKIEEINQDREKFQEAVMESVEVELGKVGLRVINVNIKDVDDESGYIKALGQKAASEAINQARIDVAEQERKGQTGVAEAHKESDIAVSLANKEKRVGVSAAEAEAIKGENLASQVKAMSDAELREKIAEANRRATVAEKTMEAEANKLAYRAQMEAEIARQERDKAARLADVIPNTEANKQKIIIDAEALVEQQAREGRGAGERVRNEMQGKAEGIRAVFAANADGIRQMMDAAGGTSNAAFLLMMADRIPEMMDIQAKAISNLKIDKVTVWDGGQSNGKTISNFVKDYATSLPPLHDLLKMTGIVAPGFMGEAEKERRDAHSVSDEDWDAGLEGGEFSDEDSTGDHEGPDCCGKATKF